MSNIVKYNGGSGGGGGGAIVAVPLLLIASFSVRSGLEGCGRQGTKYIDNVVPYTKPYRSIEPYNPYKNVNDPYNPHKKFDQTYPYDPYPGYKTEKEDKTKDVLDLGKDILEEAVEPKDSSDKKKR